MNEPRLLPGSTVVTPEMAEWIIGSFRFWGQRREYDHQVSMLADFMVSGEWLDDDQVSFAVMPDNHLYMVNGYHRMKAVVLAGSPVRFYFRFVPCDTREEVETLYNKFDTATRNRSESEVLNAAGISGKYGLQRRTASAVYKSAVLIANDFQVINYQNAASELRGVTNKIRNASAYWEYGKVYEQLIRQGWNEHASKMLNCGYVAVALVTLSYQPEKASKFWLAVATMANLPSNDPRMILAKYIDNKRGKTIGKTKDGEVPETSKAAALAWNAYYKGRSMAVLRTAAAFRLEGTRWNK